MNIFAQKASNFRGTHPFLGKIFVGLSAASLAMSAYKYLQAKGAEAEVEYRKRQLAKPLIKLSDEQLINPPWNKNNLDEWLYRRVEVSGRPIHRLACLIPRNVCGGLGFEYVVPFVVKQNEDRTVQYGAILSKGFLPLRWEHIGNRYKLEDATRQTFVGFLGRLEQLQGTSPFEGNCIQQGRCSKYTYANIDDFVRTAGFKNKKEASLVVIERLYEIGDYNERRGKRYSADSDFHQDYPYYKTEAGALQLPEMPWDLQNKAKVYLAAGLGCFAVGASIF